MRATLALVLGLLCLTARGQGVDDSGATEDTGQDDLGNQDPSILGPSNKQGYGRDVPTQLNDGVKQDKKEGSGKGKKGEDSDPHGTMAEQTVQAALQFGVLVRRCTLRTF